MELLETYLSAAYEHQVIIYGIKIPLVYCSCSLAIHIFISCSPIFILARSHAIESSIQGVPIKKNATFFFAEQSDKTLL